MLTRQKSNMSDKLTNRGDQGPVALDVWVAANHPRLHPTRRKVLEAVCRLTSGGEPTSSSQVRREVNISQQLLNRHLRALEKQGLVSLTNQGPGLPLQVMATAAGQRLVTWSPPPRHEEPPAQAGPPAVPAPPAPATAPAPPEEAAAPATAPAPPEEAAAPATAPAPPEEAAAPDEEQPPEPAAEEPESDIWERKPVPPPLSPAEEALEQRLAATVHPDYQHLPWYQRTREFSNEWDQQRRRRLGVLTTYFSSFTPRWERPDWYHFNQGRRQADARGARYQDWIAAQFQRLAPDGNGEVWPKDLHGKEAAQAYENSRNPQAGGGKRRLGPPPYTVDSFSLSNPEHVAYAEQLLEEMAELGENIYGDPDEGAVRLLVQAICSQKFPPAALDLAPRWKQKVLAELGSRRQNGAAPLHAVRHDVII